jgi:hypothetical protein
LIFLPLCLLPDSFPARPARDGTEAAAAQRYINPARLV